MKKGPRTKRFILLSLAAILLSLAGRAQSNLIFYNSGDQINAPNLNPAFLTGEGKLTLSLFPFAGLTVGYNDQKVMNEMIVNVLRGEQDNEKFKTVFRSMLGEDLFFQRLEIPILNLGYRSGQGSFNFRIKDNMRLMTDLKGELSDFLSDPSVLAVPMNKAQDFPIHAMYYREYSLGYARELIKSKLTIGVRAKAYFGKFSMISNVRGSSEFQNNNYYFRTSNQMKMSFPAKLILDENDDLKSITTADDFSVGSFLFNAKNFGAGFDIGFDYQVNDNVSFSASVTDVGQIKWKNNLNSMDYFGEYQFDPKYIDYSQSDDNHLVRSPDYPAETQQIPSLFKVALNPAPYTTAMPVSVYAGLKYKASGHLTWGVADRYVSVAQMAYNSFSISADYVLSEKWRLLTGYGKQGPTYFNLPLAFIRSWSAGQFFIGTDNILSVVSGASDYAGVSFGATIFLFSQAANRKMQIDYLPFFELKRKKAR